MCYPKPGPRCASHARARLQRASEAYEKDQTYETFAALKDAEKDYDATVEGQEKLLEAIEEYESLSREDSDDLASVMERMRSSSQVREVWKRLESGIVRREQMFALLDARDQGDAKYTSHQVDDDVSTSSSDSSPKIIKVYRNGPLHLSAYEGEIKHIADEADLHKPAGRTGRQDSLYASVDINGVSRWVRAHAYSSDREDYDTYELDVDPDAVFVYHIPTWEKFSWGRDSGRSIHPYQYWYTGIPLKDFDASQYDTTEWEVLVPPHAVKKTRRVSARRLLANLKSDYARDELSMLLKRVGVR